MYVQDISNFRIFQTNAKNFACCLLKRKREVKRIIAYARQGKASLLWVLACCSVARVTQDFHDRTTNSTFHCRTSALNQLRNVVNSMVSGFISRTNPVDSCQMKPMDNNTNRHNLYYIPFFGKKTIKSCHSIQKRKNTNSSHVYCCGLHCKQGSISLSN